VIHLGIGSDQASHDAVSNYKVGVVHVSEEFGQILGNKRPIAFSQNNYISTWY
jgi:hypothetical protein